MISTGPPGPSTSSTSVRTSNSGQGRAGSESLAIQRHRGVRPCHATGQAAPVSAGWRAMALVHWPGSPASAHRPWADEAAIQSWCPSGAWRFCSMACDQWLGRHEHAAPRLPPRTTLLCGLLNAEFSPPQYLRPRSACVTGFADVRGMPALAVSERRYPLLPNRLIRIAAADPDRRRHGPRRVPIMRSHLPSPCHKNVIFLIYSAARPTWTRGPDESRHRWCWPLAVIEMSCWRYRNAMPTV